jgi:hypothetical protein
VPLINLAAEENKAGTLLAFSPSLYSPQEKRAPTTANMNRANLYPSQTEISNFRRERQREFREEWSSASGLLIAFVTLATLLLALHYL